MKSNKKTKEMKLYELLGVNVFKKLYLKMHDMIPNNKEASETGDSHHLRKGFQLENLTDYKTQSLFNTGLEILGLLVSFIYLVARIKLISFTTPIVILDSIFILNTLTCSSGLMVDRYNRIRINKSINKMKTLRKRQKENLVNEMAAKYSYLNDYSYEIKNKKNATESFDDFLNTATLNELRSYNKMLKLYENRIEQNDKSEAFRRVKAKIRVELNNDKPKTLEKKYRNN